MRKIVQIAVGNDGYFSGGNGEIRPLTVALCNDGTAWQMVFWENGWKRLPDIPLEAPDEH